MKQVMQVTMKSVAAVSLCVLAACSTTSPDVIKPENAQRMSQVEDAVAMNNFLALFFESLNRQGKLGKCFYFLGIRHKLNMRIITFSVNGVK